mmetsp:Transcript_3714/g.8627  ORF Transcript_3714/g.8627 Transcript_3714/m.8627 type:complete len:206 (-) Transcript_3714:53-670(-)
MREPEQHPEAPPLQEARAAVSAGKHCRIWHQSDFLPVHEGQVWPHREGSGSDCCILHVLHIGGELVLGQATGETTWAEVVDRNQLACRDSVLPADLAGAVSAADTACSTFQWAFDSLYPRFDCIVLDRCHEHQWRTRRWPIDGHLSVHHDDWAVPRALDLPRLLGGFGEHFWSRRCVDPGSCPELRQHCVHRQHTAGALPRHSAC